MLELTDPLWKKLDDAHRDRDIPQLLSHLADAWDDEAANSLFWDCLCHQGTCYGATYAAIPHLLEIARPEGSKNQRLEIALFLGQIALRAFDVPSECDGGPDEVSPQGLPQTLDGWDRITDVYRRLVASLEDPDRTSSDYEQDELLPRYRRILAIDPVNESDLGKIHTIRLEFLEALPEIRSLCERALRENLQHEHAVTYLLSGVAAADGLFDLARLLESGSEGGFRCSSCGWHYEYMLFEDRVAIYMDEIPPGALPALQTDEGRCLRDYRDGAPSRSDGFLKPFNESDGIPDKRITALLAMAHQAPDPKPALLLLSFLGSFVCSKCHVDGPIKGL